jgi:hypothetical protein
MAALTLTARQGIRFFEMSNFRSQIRRTRKGQKPKPKDKRHYWLTPPELYAALDAEFHFDFDPAPYPRPEGFDGLTCEWGQSNYVNPPFISGSPDAPKGGRKAGGKRRAPGITAWARKAIAESGKGKQVVLVFPLDKWVLALLAAGARVRDLGDVKWCAVEDGTVGPGIGRKIAAFVLCPNLKLMTDN